MDPDEGIQDGVLWEGLGHTPSPTDFGFGHSGDPQFRTLCPSRFSSVPSFVYGSHTPYHHCVWRGIGWKQEWAEGLVHLSTSVSRGWGWGRRTTVVTGPLGRRPALVRSHGKPDSHGQSSNVFWFLSFLSFLLPVSSYLFVCLLPVCFPPSRSLACLPFRRLCPLIT